MGTFPCYDGGILAQQQRLKVYSGQIAGPISEFSYWYIVPFWASDTAKCRESREPGKELHKTPNTLFMFNRFNYIFNSKAI